MNYESQNCGLLVIPAHILVIHFDSNACNMYIAELGSHMHSAYTHSYLHIHTHSYTFAYTHTVHTHAYTHHAVTE